MLRLVLFSLTLSCFPSVVLAMSPQGIGAITRLFTDASIPGERYTLVPIEGEEAWNTIELTFKYEGQTYSASLSYGEGMQVLSVEVSHESHRYTVVDTGFEKLDGIPDGIYENYKKLSLTQALTRELYARHSAVVDVMIKYVKKYSQSYK